ncbi:uncharacterized protein LAESUDRAFT_718738 [Laetiporus sulphureus 93-53]|uniref:Uncharacterized protein n=1 Tax=Laetiporus sulphureus 93-53 TaxID=1314785 RepID=A0A165I1R8_9APHY|nr:uncharacterized protein LAESUDRAFT_718738 [Laetiporus sulphureus 93-53]KZT12478.1 hypothetical protein LAESUDRAFT_718738 [Laetiporus sulphureus 93-53]
MASPPETPSCWLAPRRTFFPVCLTAVIVLLTLDSLAELPARSGSGDHQEPTERSSRYQSILCDVSNSPPSTSLIATENELECTFIVHSVAQRRPSDESRNVLLRILSSAKLLTVFGNACTANRVPISGHTDNQHRGPRRMTAFSHSPGMDASDV